MATDFKKLYTELFHKYYSGLLFYATRLVGEDDADDIVQDVFVDLWKRREQLEIGDQVQALLYRSVYTRAINLLKHQAVVESYSAAEKELNNRRMEYYQPDNTEIMHRMENRELRKEIFIAINELPDKCREVFKLSYLHNMKNKDIADVLNVSLRTVEAHMYKALKFLRERLGYLLRLLIVMILDT